MCNPLLIAAAAMTAGSVAMNSAAASKAQKAQDAVYAAERQRQKGFDQETGLLNDQSQDRYKDFGGQQDDKAGELSQFFTEQSAAAKDAPTEMAPTAGSNVVVQEQAKQKSKANAYTQQQGDAKANLRSFGDLLGGISLQQARDAGQIGTIGGFKKGSSAVVPLELDNASHKGDKYKLFGDLLGGGGQLAMMGGLNGFGGSFGGASPTAKPWVNPDTGFVGQLGKSPYLETGSPNPFNLYG